KTPTVMRPTRSHDHDQIARIARAQRLVIIDPIPSQTSAPASAPYRATMGKMLGMAGGGLGPLAAIAAPNITSGTSSAQQHPRKAVAAPKIIKPILRSLNCAGGSEAGFIASEASKAGYDCRR